MNIKPRHMKKYTPRRRKNSQVIQQQQLEDFEHLLNMDLNTFLILKEEGTPKQIERAKTKARANLLKYGQDMEKIAKDVGDNVIELVHGFLQSLTRLVHNSSDHIDPAPINEHYKISERLYRMLKSNLEAKKANSNKET